MTKNTIIIIGISTILLGGITFVTIKLLSKKKRKEKLKKDWKKDEKIIDKESTEAPSPPPPAQPINEFNPQPFAETIYKSLKGADNWGTGFDGTLFKSVVTSLNKTQLKEVEKHFNKAYAGKSNLKTWIEDEVWHPFGWYGNLTQAQALAYFGY